MNTLKVATIGLWTLARKEVSRVFRIWVQSMVPPLVTAVLYFMIFGHVIGSRIGTMGGVPYIQFLVPGFVMLSVINSAYSNVAGAFYLSKFTRSIDELLISPMSSFLVMLGYVLGGVVRALIVGCIVIAIGYFFTTIHIQHVFFTLFVMCLVSAIFSVAGFVNGMFANSFDGISMVPNFILTPLIYLGGVFYQIDALPKPWRTISSFNPVYYMVDSFRSAMLYANASLLKDVVILLAVLAPLVVLAWVLYNKSTRLRN